MLDHTAKKKFIEQAGTMDEKKLKEQEKKFLDKKRKRIKKLNIKKKLLVFLGGVILILSIALFFVDKNAFIIPDNTPVSILYKTIALVNKHNLLFFFSSYLIFFMGVFCGVKAKRLKEELSSPVLATRIK